MQPAGLASFEKRVGGRSKIYSYEKDEVEFTPGFKKQFKANKKAWDYFQSLAPSYRKVSSLWVMGAKHETTKSTNLRQFDRIKPVERQQIQKMTCTTTNC